MQFTGSPKFLAYNAIYIFIAQDSEEYRARDQQEYQRERKILFFLKRKKESFF